MMKKAGIILLLVMAMMAFTACGNDAKTDTNDVATIGDVKISQKQVDEYATLFYFTQGYDLSQVEDETQLAAVKSMVLSDMVTLEVIKLYYQDSKDKVLPETIDEDQKAFLEETKTNEEVKTFLTDNGISEDTLTRFFLNQYYNVAFFNEIEAGMPNLEQDIKDYYEANKEEFKLDQVEASHILVKTEQEAKQILADLKAGGDFATIAKEKSIDTGSAVNGGELGFFDRNTMVTEFSDVAFALKPGEISDPVKSEFGYHIIKVTDKKDGYQTLEEATESIRTNLIGTAFETKVAQLKEEYKVKL